MQRSGRTGLAPLLVLSLVLSSTACDITTTGPVRTDLNASDRDALSPGGRVSFAIMPRQDPKQTGLLELASSASSSASNSSARAESSGPEGNDDPTSAPDSQPTAPAKDPILVPLIAIELDHRTSIGHEDRAGLSGGFFVDYDGRTIVGPETLDHDFTLHLTTANVRVGGRLFEMLSVEALGGLSTSALHYVVRTPTSRTGDTSVGLGANGGARVTLTPHPVLDFYGQAQFHVLDGLQKDHDTIVVPSAEVGSNLHLSRNVSVFGGWRWSSYSEVIEGQSDLDDIEADGPTFGAALRF